MLHIVAIRMIGLVFKIDWFGSNSNPAETYATAIQSRKLCSLSRLLYTGGK
jgi:hypothetical protein